MAPQQELGTSLVKTLEDVWEKFLYLQLNLTEEQWLKVFQKIRHCEDVEKDMAEIVQELCGLWEESLRLFNNLSDTDRKAWLQDAKDRGPIEARFATALQERHHQMIRPPKGIAL